MGSQGEDGFSILDDETILADLAEEIAKLEEFQVSEEDLAGLLSDTDIDLPDFQIVCPHCGKPI